MPATTLPTRDSYDHPVFMVSLTAFHDPGTPVNEGPAPVFYYLRGTPAEVIASVAKHAAEIFSVPEVARAWKKHDKKLRNK